MEPNILSLGFVALASATAHFFAKYDTVNRTEPITLGDYAFKNIAQIVISLCGILVVCIAHESIFVLNLAGKIAGDYIYIAFVALGWSANSIIFRIAQLAGDVKNLDGKNRS